MSSSSVHPAFVQSKAQRDQRFAAEVGSKGLKIERRFTRAGESPFADIEFELRTSRIANPDGSVVFEMKNVEVPKSWSQVATDVLAQKYIRKRGVPQIDRETGKPLLDKQDNPILGAEWSAKQVVGRLAGTWRHWGEEYGYFETKEDADAFEDEMNYLLITQASAPNSPQWFNTGLAWAYGITGEAQGHFYVDEKTGKLKRSEDAYTRPQPHACGRWDTKIMTEEGILNLGAIVDKNRVGLRIFDGHRFVRILATAENGIRKLYRMTLKNGQYIDFTDDHLVWAAEKRCKDGGVYNWVPLAKCLGKRVQLAPLHVPSRVNLPEKVAIAEAALAGFHIGDGYHGTYNGITHFGVCTNDTDEFEHVTDLFNQIFGGYTVTKKPQISPNYRIIRRDFNETIFFAERYGLGLGSHAVRIHDTIFAADDDVKSAFLRGLFQADGCVRIRRRGKTSSGDICLTTISEGLAHDVQMLLLSLGIYSRVTRCRDQREDRSMQYHVEIAYASERERFESRIGFISQSKIRKLRELNTVVLGKNKSFISEEEVISIDYIGEELVYDVQTETGQFVANGVIVHNCFIQSVKDDLVNKGGIFDGVMREALLFKYGSGTGSNFSNIRGCNESLGGGGKSSGLMSFLGIFDRAAGAIKSGGTTRRAAKMVCVDMDHPEIESFINWKVIEEQKVAALVAGSHICYEKLKAIVASVHDKGADAAKNPDLKRLILDASKAHVSLNYVKRVILMVVENGLTPERFTFRTYDTDFRSEAYATVGGQNSNNSVRVTNAFIEAVEKDGDWDLVNRVDKKVAKTVKARELWDQIAEAAWQCADPGLQYDTTINEWHTCPEDGQINASNPCVTGDTLVSTTMGYRRIVDLVGTVPEIVSPSGTARRVRAVFRTGYKPVYELKTKSGYTLNVTADHLIYTKNRGYVVASHLTSDDVLVLGGVGFGHDTLALPLAETFGFAMGDGCVTGEQRTLFLTLGYEEMGLAQTFNRVLNSYKKAHAEDGRSGRDSTVVLTPTSVRVGTSSRVVVELLQSYGFLNKGASHKSFTDSVFNLDRDTQAAILRGLFTADGTVAQYGTKSHYVALDSASKTLLKQVQLLLLGFGIKSKLYENRRAGVLTSDLPNGRGGMQTYGVQEMHSLRISRSSRFGFEKWIGFMPGSVKALRLAVLNESVSAYRDKMEDSFASFTYLGEENVYDLTEPMESAFVANGVHIHNCSEYMFLDDTACNLASINLIKFYDAETKQFDVDGFRHACHLWTMVLEISVLMAQFPSEAIAELSYKFRTLGLGYANIGSLLMQMGVPYDSEEGMAICGAITALMCGEAYATSAEIAKVRGAFPGYSKNAEHMLRVIRNHRRAAYNIEPKEYEGLTVSPVGIDSEGVKQTNLLESARDAWDRALEWGEKYGYRNAQVTVIAPTGTIGLVMDCDTTGIEPDFALVKFKKLVGGGYFKIANQSIRPALENLNYTAKQIEDILHYVKGYGTLVNSPTVTHDELHGKGFSDKEIMAIEGQLTSVFELKFAFNKWTLGEDFCQEILRMSPEQLENSEFNLLAYLGFSEEEIEQANIYVCGTMTIEGAPHLEKDHYPVFDCANKCGKIGQRFIGTKGHIRMMAAAQPFISGAISKTINMPEDATIEDVQSAYMTSWKYMLKANALYRDGSKLSQPLSTSSMAGNLASLFDFTAEELEIGPETMHREVLEKIIQKPFRRKLPNERHSITHKFSIQGHEGYITCGLYEDGQPGEVFIKMSKEGSTLSGIMDAFALSLSMNLQYGVPLEVLVSKFTHTRFEPAGMTQNSEIPMVKSIMDYLGRWLALKFLPKESAKKYHNAELVERAYAQGTLAKRDFTHLQEDFEKMVESINDDRTPGAALKASVMLEHEEVAVREKVSIAGVEQLATLQSNMALRMNNEDAPMCTTCGSVMVRNGACYKCVGCGDTSGCS